MANRSLLHRNRLEEFTTWLKRHDYELLEPKGEYEVLRWRGEPSMPMPIVFTKLSNHEHLSCNNGAVPYVRRFLEETRGNKNSEHSGT